MRRPSLTEAARARLRPAKPLRPVGLRSPALEFTSLKIALRAALRSCTRGILISVSVRTNPGAESVRQVRAARRGRQDPRRAPVVVRLRALVPCVAKCATGSALAHAATPSTPALRSRLRSGPRLRSRYTARMGAQFMAGNVFGVSLKHGVM